MMRIPGWSRLQTLWGRSRLRALWGWFRRRTRRIRLPAGLKRALLIAAACAVVAVLTAGGLPVLRRLYVMGWIAGEHYQIAFAALCIVPAAAVHWGAAHSGRRGAAWWTVWLPGIVVYAAFPWRKRETWEALGIFGHAWDWARTIFLHWNTAPPEVFNNFGAFVTMLAVTIVAVGKLWLGAGKAVGRLGPDTAAAPEDVLPSATWASRSDVVERFSVPGGIVLGELTDPVKESPEFEPDRVETWGGQGDGQLITLSPTDGNGHVLVTSQASGFKSTGLVIPNILNYRKGPVIVFDPKCELYARTWQARKDMGFRPVVIDETNGFDPARLISLLAVDHPSAYRRMARMMIPKGYGAVENGQFFKDAALGLFTALLGFYGERGSPHIIQDIAKLLAQSPDKVYEEISDRLLQSELPFVRNHLSELEGMDERFWGSIKTEITNQLMFSEMPDILRYVAMDPKSPLPAQILDPECDIFLNIPQHVAEDFAPMLRLMLGSMLTAAEFIEVNEDPRARRLFLIDEAAKLGNMDILENIRDRGRSRGLHLMLFYQTPGEIERIWGRAGMTSWRDGCSATIMGPVSSRTSATEISSMIGRRHVRVRTGSTSSSSQVMSAMSGSVSSSQQEQVRDVAVISPTEISQLPTHASIITATGKKPILASKAIWFTRKDMQGRVRSTEDIKPELAVTKSQDELMKRLAKLLPPADGAAAAAAAQEQAAPQPEGDRTPAEAVPKDGLAAEQEVADGETANGAQSQASPEPAGVQGEGAKPPAPPTAKESAPEQDGAAIHPAPSNDVEPEGDGHASARDNWGDATASAETQAAPGTKPGGGAAPGTAEAGTRRDGRSTGTAPEENADDKAGPPDPETAKSTEKEDGSGPTGGQDEAARPATRPARAKQAPGPATEQRAAQRPDEDGIEAAATREEDQDVAPGLQDAETVGDTESVEGADTVAAQDGTATPSADNGVEADGDSEPNAGPPDWTEAEARKFVHLSQLQMSLPDIAAGLGKSLAEVEAWSEDRCARALVPRGTMKPKGEDVAAGPEDDGPGGPS